MSTRDLFAFVVGSLECFINEFDHSEAVAAGAGRYDYMRGSYGR
jgi:hypothetical protein